MQTTTSWGHTFFHMLTPTYHSNKSVSFSLFDSVSFGLIQNKKILILIINNQTKYFIIPNFVYCHSDGLNLNFSCLSIDKKDFIDFNLFSNLIFQFGKSRNLIIKKKLRLKGLGFRINLSSDLNFLELKVGFSHQILLPIPFNKIKVIIQKNICIVEGFNKVDVGNFLSSIRSSKIPDDYKGKGFWYSNQKENLKVIKKK